MDSSIPPPPPSRTAQSLRPWYLVAAMVMTWFAGVHGMTAGCANAMFLREGRVPDLNAAAHSMKAGTDVMDFAALMRAAELQAMLANVKLTFPLSLADAMLGGLLVIASGLAMGGRTGARSLALQAIAANALFAAAAFVLTRTVRGSWIDVVTHAAAALPVGMPQRDFANGQVLWWAMRVKLTLYLGPLALGALALMGARTKAFFDAVARTTESSDDP